jgi:hypothetical protein
MMHVPVRGKLRFDPRVDFVCLWAAGLMGQVTPSYLKRVVFTLLIFQTYFLNNNNTQHIFFSKFAETKEPKMVQRPANR